MPSLIERCPIDAPAEVKRWRDRHVLCLGEVISAAERTVLRPAFCPRDQPSGSIGFTNFTLGTWDLPDIAAIFTIGVEPAYQGRGYGEMMVDWFERLGRLLDFSTVAVMYVKNDLLMQMLSRRGYSDEDTEYNIWKKEL